MDQYFALQTGKKQYRVFELVEPKLWRLLNTYSSRARAFFAVHRLREKKKPRARVRLDD